jgi:hypothetical protein
MVAMFATTPKQRDHVRGIVGDRRGETVEPVGVG